MYMLDVDNGDDDDEDEENPEDDNAEIEKRLF